MKKALITGITGQDGSYLAELLLEKGYEVHGIVRRASVSTTQRIDHIIDKLHLHEGDLSDSTSIIRVIGAVRPDEKIVDEYSVWVNSDITKTEEGFEYHMVQYTKDEYIKLMDEANLKAQADLEYIAMMTEVELE